MLHAFFIKNYCSIKQTKLELSFKERKAPSGYQELEEWVFLEAGQKIVLFHVYQCNEDESNGTKILCNQGCKVN